ncbi:MAG: NAD-dependent epimerase/dehydratase family protein, partial [Candidatus Methanomethyliaceae archaeon]|nr:NAD-dependent epimerase/dehydratase family protein [Candidatus Methanomethyliaceae archaeon]
AKEGHEVIILDNFSTVSMENINEILSMKNVHLLEGDILNYEFLLSIMKDIEIISHQAAQLEIGSAIGDPIKDAKTNIEGTINILEAARVSNVKKIIYASSAGIYGEALKIPQDEEHPKRPQWPYGVSKYAGELYCQQYSLLYGMNICALRYGIVYGEREWYGRVLTEFIKRVVLEGKPPVIFGDGMQRRDFVYVGDVVEFHNIFINEDWKGFEAYNVGGGGSVTIKELAWLVIKLADSSFEPIFEDTEEGRCSKITGRWRIPKELKCLELDISKAINKGWRPRTKLEDGVMREINWIKRNPNRWLVRRV